ncbi:hypothetical protein M407DRAFT_7720 [Tulasnella calospora MUT 4182]|uniref:Uncharacterized protein n=1 Tax=Tulasnella calospora MUT 4182 TaxID=1051891 RepID=A0A0C3QK24_9AGAM|nr:hypothetical protein M407DRAFT_7720 [Tulasnella calospora MUT 4182]
MAHIDSLPEELLSLIFHATFEEIKASSVSNWEDVGTLPDLLNILLVSSSWNRVAVATPSLWTFIAVDRKGFESARKRVRRDLVRSKHCPLDVVVRMHYLFRPGSEELSAFDSLFEEIAQHAHRWQTLRFNNLTQRALNVLEQHLPRLVSLSIIGSLGERPLKLSTPLLKRYTAPSGNSSLPSFETPPSLTHLKHVLTSRNAPAVLQHLRRSQRTLTALNLICAAPLGTQFSIHLENGVEFIAENLDLSLPTLTEYTVKFGVPGPWGWNAFRIAHMPHLRRLDVHWATFQYSNPDNTVPFMPQLTSLNIFAQNSYGFKDAAPPLAAATPNVKEVSLVQLYLGLSPYETEWLPPLLHPSQNLLTVAWPRLEILQLHGMAIRVLDDLRGIPLVRPAFQRLCVDPTCWNKSMAVGQDLHALREYFDVVVTGQP